MQAERAKPGRLPLQDAYGKKPVSEALERISSEMRAYNNILWLLATKRPNLTDREVSQIGGGREEMYGVMIMGRCKAHVELKGYVAPRLKLVASSAGLEKGIDELLKMGLSEMDEVIRTRSTDPAKNRFSQAYFKIMVELQAELRRLFEDAKQGRSPRKPTWIQYRQ